MNTTGKTTLWGYPASAILLASDKVHFYLSSCVNKQNFRYWVEANAQKLLEQITTQPTCRCLVLCCICWYLRALLFRDWDLTVTINTDRYFGNFLEPKFTKPGNPDVWSRENGATPHTARRLMDVLWFFFCGYLKTEVCKHPPRTIDEVKAENLENSTTNVYREWTISFSEPSQNIHFENMKDNFK